MKIVSIQPYILCQQLDEPFSFSQWEYAERKICIVKVITESGIVGWGEGYGPAEVLYSGIQFLKQYVIGMEALNTEGIWYTMYRRTLDYARRGILVASISAIDIAIWDIKGKILNQSVSVLLGGRKREHIRAYATGMYFCETNCLATKLSDEALSYKTAGFDAMKMKVGLSIPEDIKNVRAVRKAIGDNIMLMIDANHAYNGIEAIALAKAIEELNIAWFEEPVSPEHYDAYKNLRSKTIIPIAGGECEYLQAGFYQLFINQSVDIAQPDICAAGGITEVKRIINLASTFGVSVVPHSWGTGIALSAALQMISNMDIFPGRLKEPEALMEFDQTENELRDKLIFPKLKAVDGRISIPDKPGLGFDVDEEYVEHSSKK
jgi:D-galactarolactone cycloisomerase